MHLEKSATHPSRRSLSLRIWLSAGIIAVAATWALPALAADPEYVPNVGPGSVFYPALSGDGSTMAWAHRDGARPSLVLQNLATNAQTTFDLRTATGDAILDFPNVVLPSLSDDGTRVALVADGPAGSRGPEILLVLTDAGEELARVTAVDRFGDVALFIDRAFISGNGRYVVFTGSNRARSFSSSTAGGDDSLAVTNEVENVLRLDIQTGALVLASINSSGTQSDDESYAEGVSDDGRYVLFSSYATDLPGATGEFLAYRSDLVSNTVVQVSVDAAGAPVSAVDDCGFNCSNVGISDDGARVVFTESRDNSSDGNEHTYVWIEAAGSIEITGLDIYGSNAISGDGRWLAPEREPFSRVEIDSGATDPVSFLMEDTRISDDGSVMLFFNSSLTKPAGQTGNWWVLRNEAPAPSDLIVLVLDGPVYPGSTFEARAAGFKPLSLVQAFLESTPVLVGGENAAANGRVSFTITVPPDFPPGPHTLALEGIAPDDTPRRLTATIDISVPSLILKSGFEAAEGVFGNP